MNSDVVLSVIRVVQPIGEIYIGSIPSRKLWEIAEYDMREIREKEDGIYLATGIQRKLDERRVSEIATYVTTVDATFPTAVVLAVSSDCVNFNGSGEGGCLEMRLASSPEEENPSEEGGLFAYRRIARVIDGQHRIEGLKRSQKEDFDVNVAIFVDADIEDQARVFATVNLSQTKVSKSLVYDLFSYSTALSPEKMAHSVCLSLDQTKGSPLHHRIKRLGTATPGRTREEPLSQATFVEGILSHIVPSKEQLIRDRDWARRGKRFPKPSLTEARRLVLRRFFVEGRSVDVAELLWNYFEAVTKVFKDDWKVGGVGSILPRTNGYRALMRFFRDAYNEIAAPGDLVSTEEFERIFKRVKHLRGQFTTDNYPPGTSGESRLYSDLRQALR
ncbi:MAG TPA: DGQHR domain-containing protein [Allosphingosinicella sp.]|jgi:DGQHR domain-containing protein